ncbi:MAG: Trk family potassium uptake protein [Clostridia bacterium]|nr:Trk family potassium uptake protein [Clostridia bacterium]
MVKRKKRNKLSHIQVIALGFLLMIAAGTALLMLPIATRSREVTPFLTALFTSTSASCVTGLVLVDTGTYWSLFGQLVILALIQLGGLGIITIATLFFTLADKNMGLRKRAIMAESINTTHIAGLKGLTRRIVLGTLLFEGVGAVLLSIRFIRDFGPLKGIWFGVFHSISAFCNAGFDVLGVREPYCSFVDYSDDLLVNLTLMSLITVGGAGFLVWTDLQRNGLRWRRYQLHTKLVLCVSAVLTFGGALLFWLYERNGVLAGLSAKEQILDALFSSVTCRTAGMNTVEISDLSTPSKLLMSFLMFVGGSSGSTAGGIKTTTLAVALFYMFAGLRGVRQPTVFGRTVSGETGKKALCVMMINFLLAFTGTIVISAVQELPALDVIYETSSAMGTVGLTAGITRDLVTASRLVIVFLMFCGRVGSTSFALALFEKRAEPPVTYPEEDITVG